MARRGARSDASGAHEAVEALAHDGPVGAGRPVDRAVVVGRNANLAEQQCDSLAIEGLVVNIQEMFEALVRSVNEA